MKQCIACSAVKEIDAFYRHKRMADGRFNECKECHKKYQRKRREAGSEQKRWLDPKRRAYVKMQQRKYRTANPQKYRAHSAVSNAVRDGRLVRLPCEVCGQPKSQAHHHDYSKPLDVRWLCFKHHREMEHGQIILA